MDSLFKATKIINSIALVFLLLGAYGLPITGALQILAASMYFFVFPKSKLIYIYFLLAIVFFILWDGEKFNWLFSIPFFLILLLTYIIHFNKQRS
jgi:uncharacterized protein